MIDFAIPTPPATVSVPFPGPVDSIVPVYCPVGALTMFIFVVPVTVKFPIEALEIVPVVTEILETIALCKIAGPWIDKPPPTHSDIPTPSPPETTTLPLEGEVVSIKAVNEDVVHDNVVRLAFVAVN